MAQLTCELCHGTDFVKEAGVFVCQGCGCKYSVEDAQKMMAAATRVEAVAAHKAMAQEDPSRQSPASPFAKMAGAMREAAGQAAAAAGIPPKIETLADFQPAAVNAGIAGARAVNNYVCQGWQLLLMEYGKIEHPTKEQQESLAARARECLALLDNAAMIDPADNVQALLIYENCREIVSSARATKYHEQRSDGSYVTWSMPATVKLSLPGQSGSWDEKAAAHRAPIAAEYTAAHPDEVEYRAALENQKAQLEAELAELKDEKKSHGFFDFAGKREVKDRMAPVKDQIGDVSVQLRHLDDKIGDYVSARLTEAGAGWVRLDF